MRNFVIKIIIALLLVLAVLLTIHFLKKGKENGVQEEKNITIIIKDENETELRNDLYKVTKESLLDIMEKNYIIRYEGTKNNAFLYEIDELKTDGQTYFIAILINGEFATTGISGIVLEDKMIITFKKMAIEW